MSNISINTTISSHKTVGEILAALANAGAERIEVSYQKSLPVRISFVHTTKTEIEMRFIIDSRHGEIYDKMAALSAARITPSDKQKVRVAWQHHKNWIVSQCEMINSGAILFERAMVPYLVDSSGRLVCDMIFAEQSPQFLKIEIPNG